MNYDPACRTSPMVLDDVPARLPHDTVAVLGIWDQNIARYKRLSVPADTLIDLRLCMRRSSAIVTLRLQYAKTEHVPAAITTTPSIEGRLGFPRRPVPKQEPCKDPY